MRSLRFLVVLVGLSTSLGCRTCPTVPPKVVVVTRWKPCLTRPLPPWQSFIGDLPGESGCPSVYGICYLPRSAAAVLANMKAYRDWAADAARDCAVR